MAEVVNVTEKAGRDPVMWSPERLMQVNLRVGLEMHTDDIKTGSDIFSGKSMEETWLPSM